MNCHETIALLGDYVEHLLSPELLGELEAHLSDCAPCRAYLATFSRTCDLTRHADPVEMPPDLKARLRQFLLRQLREPRNDPGDPPVVDDASGGSAPR